jgi:hypothetical protein
MVGFLLWQSLTSSVSLHSPQKAQKGQPLRTARKRLPLLLSPILSGVGTGESFIVRKSLYFSLSLFALPQTAVSGHSL